MSAQSSPVLSLIVATFGRADVLERLVTSLANQTCTNFEVIVADQNPDDRVEPHLARLESSGRSCRHVRLPEPNLSGARNAGLALARGEFVAFPDDDCWYEPDTIARVVRAFELEKDLDGLAARWQEAAPEKGDGARAITPEAMRSFRAGNLASITLFLRRAAIVAAGGFDERIGVGRWYGSAEETDLVLSLLAGGARLERHPDIIVHHAVPAMAAQAPPQNFTGERRRARGTGALYAKHRLPVWVIGRGLIAPITQAPHTGFINALAKSVGRLEGLVRWSLNERRPPPDRVGAGRRTPA